MKSLVHILRRWRQTIVPLPVKYGRQFRRTLRFLQEHQHASRDELAAYQWKRLEALVRYAYDHVPFYHERFNSEGIHPEDIKTPDDFRLIPPLTREEVVNNQEQLKSDEFKKFRPIYGLTSGTTRDQMPFYRSAETEVWRHAVVWRHYLNIGYRFRDPRAQIALPLSFTGDCREMPIDYNENALLIDPLSISAEHAPEIYRRLKTFGAKMLFAHPGTLTSLVQHFYDQGLGPFPVPLIYVMGEKVYPEYREAIGSFFGGRIVEYYANRENTVAVTQLLDDKLYIQSDYCHLEFIDENGDEVLDQPADIISTSLYNYAFPLIRYCTDDIGILRDHPSDAALNFPVMEVVGGRGKDLILTNHGLMCTYAVLYIKKYGFNRFKRMQLVQPERDRLVFKFVPTPDFKDPEDRCFLEKICQEQFGKEFKIDVELVDDIPPTKACKNRMVISEVAMDYLRGVPST